MESIADRLKERNVFEIVDSLDFFLQSRPPNGASVHRVGTIRHSLLGIIEEVRE